MALQSKQTWQPIETAPKDGTHIVLARYGWSWWDGGEEAGTPEWRKFVFGEHQNSRREFNLWWLCKGFWSDEWKNWNDGFEPSGLNNPTHWMPLPTPPKQEVK